MAGQTADGCFAFSREGDVFVHCGEQEDRITHQGNIKYFAVSDQRASLGLMTSHLAGAGAHSEYVFESTVLVDLRTHVTRRVDGGDGLISTCGSLFWETDRDRQRSSGRDLLGGPDVVAPLYDWFRCSADRRVIAGIKGAGLYRGTPPTERLGDTRNVPFSPFNLSPDGSKVADYDSSGRVCVYSEGRVCQAQPDLNPTYDLLSIDDRGNVLVSVETNSTCYKHGNRNSPAPCVGVGLWRAGSKATEIVVSEGAGPQWVNSDTAHLLRGWAAAQVKMKGR